MTVDERAPRHHVVDIFTAVGILDPRSRGPANEQRVAADRLERAHRTIDAARQNLTRASEEPERSRSLHRTGMRRIAERSATTANNDARALPGVAALVENDAAVDDDRLDTHRILKRVREGGTVAYGCGIEDDEIGREPGLDETAIGEVQLCRREAGHLVHGLLERNDVLLANVLAEH